jgi:hypothetical protein
MIEVWSPAQARDFPSNLCVQTSYGVHPASCTMGTGGPIPRGKSWSGRHTDHSPPHVVLRSWMRSYLSSPPLCLHRSVVGLLYLLTILVSIMIHTYFHPSYTYILYRELCLYSLFSQNKKQCIRIIQNNWKIKSLYIVNSTVSESRQETISNRMIISIFEFVPPLIWLQTTFLYINAVSSYLNLEHSQMIYYI